MHGLTYSGGTERPGELCYNFSISYSLTQLVNFLTRIPHYGSHSPALLDLFLSSDPSICSTKAFPPLGNSDHVVVSVSIEFPINSEWDALFHRISYNYLIQINFGVKKIWHNWCKMAKTVNLNLHQI